MKADITLLFVMAKETPTEEMGIRNPNLILQTRYLPIQRVVLSTVDTTVQQKGRNCYIGTVHKPLELF